MPASFCAGASFSGANCTKSKSASGSARIVSFSKTGSCGSFLFVGIPVAVAEGIDGGFELGFCVGGVDDGCKKTLLRIDDGFFRLVQPSDERGTFPVFGLNDIARFPRDLMDFACDVCLIDTGEVVVIMTP